MQNYGNNHTLQEMYKVRNLIISRYRYYRDYIYKCLLIFQKWGYRNREKRGESADIIT